MSRILIALGGNALGNNYLEQQNLIKDALLNLIDLFEDNEIIITHGNGPQVGMITDAFNNTLPLDVCTAMSEGYIGFHIQRELKEILSKCKINRDVVTVLTEVLVDENDIAFTDPSKPIGKFYSKEEADKLMKGSDDIYVMDAGRGYRKVVASPSPLDIKNISSIEALLKNDSIVIAAGGGIPIIRDNNSTGVNAVIDKDFASALLACKLHADKFIILTAVDQVMLDFDTSEPKKIEKMNIDEAKDYILKNEFKKGSMLPKIEAAIIFTDYTSNKTVITSLNNAENILEEKNVTVIEK